ncbi:MAG: hypothetical protein ACXWC9_09665, partial [Pseudobdellovibrionaceae bacterium]
FPDESLATKETASMKTLITSILIAMLTLTLGLSAEAKSTGYIAASTYLNAGKAERKKSHAGKKKNKKDKLAKHKVKKGKRSIASEKSYKSKKKNKKSKKRRHS